MRSGGGFGIAGMRRAEEEEEDEESETETETEGLWWKKCEPFGEAWSFSGSAARMPNDASEGPYAKPLWCLMCLLLASGFDYDMDNEYDSLRFALLYLRIVLGCFVLGFTWSREENGIHGSLLFVIWV